MPSMNEAVETFNDETVEAVMRGETLGEESGEAIETYDDDDVIVGDPFTINTPEDVDTFVSQLFASTSEDADDL